MDEVETGNRHRWQAQDRFLKSPTDEFDRLVFDLQDAISRVTTQFFGDLGLKTFHAPVTTSSISSPIGRGSDSKPVLVDLFGVPTYLADSMQFMLEYGCRLSDKGCYYIMPSFRGEQTDRWHLREFYHSEAEIPGGFDDVIMLVDTYVRHLAGQIRTQFEQRIRDVVGDIGHLRRLTESTGALPRVKFNQAVELLGDRPEYIKHHEDGFRTVTRSGEQRLVELVGASTDCVWLTHFDPLSVPFYQAVTPEDGALAADLLMAQVGEVVGSGERHGTSDEVRAALQSHEVAAEPYHWYIEMKDRFALRTAGFGMGSERFLCWVLQHDDIRDCQLFRRANGVPCCP